MWTERTSIHVYGDTDSTTRLFEVLADESNDKSIKLPVIALRRSPPGYTISRLIKNPMSFDGARLESTENKSILLNAIPIKLQYQLDIYTRYKEEAEEYARNLIFNFTNYPKLQVVVPYLGKDYIHNSSVKLAANMDDNSDVPERISFGQFTRYTLSLFIEDAYLWDIREKDNYSIQVNGVYIDDENIIECDC